MATKKPKDESQTEDTGTTGTGETKQRKPREPRIKVDANSSKGQLLEFVGKLTDAESQSLKCKLKTIYNDISDNEDAFIKELHNNTRIALGLA